MSITRTHKKTGVRKKKNNNIAVSKSENLLK